MDNNAWLRGQPFTLPLDKHQKKKTLTTQVGRGVPRYWPDTFACSQAACPRRSDRSPHPAPTTLDFAVKHRRGRKARLLFPRGGLLLSSRGRLGTSVPVGTTVSAPVLTGLAVGGPVDVGITSGGDVGSKGGVDTTGRGAASDVVVEALDSADLGTTLLTSDGGGSGSLGGNGLLLLLLDLFRVAVEEHVDHDTPAVLGAGNAAAETEDLTAEHPPHETDGMTALVVGGDGDVNEAQGSVSVAKRDDGDVDVAGLADGLVVNAGVGDDNHTGLLERAGDVVGEATGGEATSDGLSASVGGELEDSTVTVRAARDDTDIVGVLDRGNDTGSEDELLPGLTDVDQVDT